MTLFSHGECWCILAFCETLPVVVTQCNRVEPRPRGSVVGRRVVCDREHARRERTVKEMNAACLYHSNPADIFI